jgi:hypothetical protein
VGQSESKTNLGTNRAMVSLISSSTDDVICYHLAVASYSEQRDLQRGTESYSILPLLSAIITQ